LKIGDSKWPTFLIAIRLDLNFHNKIKTMNKFSPKTIENIGYYVYILLDPRDSKIFYVGKGKGNRVFEHVAGIPDNPIDSDKISLIKEIINNNQEVEHYIIRHGIENDEVALEIEATLIDLLTYNKFNHLSNITNIVTGHNTFERGIKTVDEIEILYAAEKVNPDIAIDNIFVFSVQNALNEGRSNYSATRSAWRISQEWVNTIPAFAVGLKNSFSVGSYEILQWNQVENTNRSEFISPNHPNVSSYTPLLNKDWTNIREQAMGFMGFGNYIIVEFDGQGHFRIQRGAHDHITWHNCV